ncbi:MAG: sel1 repeat family protein [Legionella sp.]|nr:sel1 repeat family protein [Legionella sp.]
MPFYILAIAGIGAIALTLGVRALIINHRERRQALARTYQAKGKQFQSENLKDYYANQRPKFAEQMLNAPNFRPDFEQAYADLGRKNEAWDVYATTKNCPVALDRLKEAAEQGSEAAQYTLGYHLNSRGATENAVTWCLKAAAKNYQPAIEYLNKTTFSAALYFFIGKAYETGFIVSKNITQASVFYSKASDLGHAEASFRLGLWCENSMNTESKTTQLNNACSYYLKASNKGHIKARTLLTNIAQKAGSEQKCLLSEFYKTQPSKKASWQKMPTFSKELTSKRQLKNTSSASSSSVHSPSYR